MVLLGELRFSGQQALIFLKKPVSFAIMNIEKVKRYSLLEVAFLLILAGGFLIAQIIVKTRSRVMLSEPIPLTGSGVSVSMPAGLGWGRTRDWKYEKTQNSMFLLGQLRMPGGAAPEVSWRYFFTSVHTLEEDRLRQRAKESGAVIKSFATTSGKHPMLYGRMISNAVLTQDCYLGIICLDFGRSVELLVKTYNDNVYDIEDLFLALASSFDYQLPHQIQDGSDLITDFFQNSAENSGSLQSQQNTFLIQDASKRNLGYYHESRSFHTDQEKPLHEFRIQRYERSVFRSVSSLWFNSIGPSYQWKTELYASRQPKPEQYEVVFNVDNGLQIFRNEHQIRHLAVIQHILPEPLLVDFAQFLLRNLADDVIVDVVSSTGQVVPVRLRKIPIEGASLKADSVVSVVRVDYLHHSKSFEELFYDKETVLLGKFEQQPGHQGLLWETVQSEQLEEIFGTDFRRVPEEVAINNLIFNE